MRLPVFALLNVMVCLVACQHDEIPIAKTTSIVLEPAPSAIPAATPIKDDPRIPMPRPTRKRLASAVAENATCEACHDDIAKEWQGSYHQRANIEPAYVRAFAIEPSPFCRSCHAPEADPFKEPPEAVSNLGVGCVSCHVTEQGVVLAAAHPDETPDPSRPAAPHPLRRSVEFAHAGGCANCHEFRFPTPGGNDDAFFMQTTTREHLRSPAAAKPCAECHMPFREGRRSHAFSEVRNEEFLRANLNVSAERTPEDTLRITLTQPNPGHDFPTGDLFRRLQIGYELLDEAGTVLRRETTYLARHFEFIPGQTGRHLTRDDRVQNEPKQIELPLPPLAEMPTNTRLSWWVTYQRVATVGKGVDPDTATVVSEVKLHAGSLPWIQPPNL